MVTQSEKSVEANDRDIGQYDRALTRRLLWKLDIRVLPALALLWLANFLDRSNVGNAGIAGLRQDLHVEGNQFNSALTVYYVTYIISELPSNWVLKRMHANRWLPLIVAAWGVVTTLTGVIQNYGGLIAIRLALGFCEGGLLPGMTLYLASMYKRSELQLRVGIFYASASLSGAFGGLLAFGLSKMDGLGNLAGWRWIFIMEGIATVLVAIFAAIILPRNLETASFLTEEERKLGLWRLRADNSASYQTAARRARSSISENSEVKDKEIPIHAEVVDHDILTDQQEVFEWREVRRGIFDVQAWLTGLAYGAFVISLYSYSVFLPTILSGLGWSGPQAQLHSVPPYVPAVVLTLVVAVFSDRWQWRGPFMLICLPIAAIGYILAIAAKTNTLRYVAAFFIAAGIYPLGPCILSLISNNSSGHYKRATTGALQLMIANCGGFISTWIYTADQAPTYIRGHAITLGFVCAAWVLVALNVAYCIWENKARREGRRKDNWRKYEELWESGKTRAPIGDRSPDFIFTL